MDRAPKALLDTLGGILIHETDLCTKSIQVVSRYTRQALYYQNQKKRTEATKKAA
jgi:hypothetical protein